MIWKKRIYKYDLLRAICIFEVILLHVGAGYTDSSYHSAITDLDYNIGMFFSLITRTSVPCFVMLSGAFMIRSSTVCLQDYYRKMKKN